MAEYRLFYSWQNDRKDIKGLVFNALKSAQAKLKTEGIDLIIDQDTSGRTGKRKIEEEVLKKIENCDIFLADLTPVTCLTKPSEEHELPKLMPNSNVMFEYGYALRAKGENRMIALACLDKQKDEHIEFMPFDVNHDTITPFTDENSLNGLTQWIKKITQLVDEERANFVPQYACTLRFSFKTDILVEDDELTITPLYKKAIYTNKPASVPEATLPESSKPVVQKWRKPHMTSINMSYAPINLIFWNQGTDALDNIELSIFPSDDRVVLAETNEEKPSGGLIGISIPSFKKEDSIKVGNMFAHQHIQTLNPSAPYVLDEFYVKAPHDIDTFYLNWVISSRTHKAEGCLTVHVQPTFVEKAIEDDKRAGTEEILDAIMKTEV